jgi:hypothetical protein
MLVAVLVILGILVGLGFMAQTNDLGCGCGWLYILAVFVLAAVVISNSH